MQPNFVDPVELVDSFSRTKSRFQVFCNYLVPKKTTSKILMMAQQI